MFLEIKGKVAMETCFATFELPLWDFTAVFRLVINDILIWLLNWLCRFLSVQGQSSFSICTLLNQLGITRQQCVFAFARLSTASLQPHQRQSFEKCETSKRKGVVANIPSDTKFTWQVCLTTVTVGTNARQHLKCRTSQRVGSQKRTFGKRYALLICEEFEL